MGFSNRKSAEKTRKLVVLLSSIISHRLAYAN